MEILQGKGMQFPPLQVEILAGEELSQGTPLAPVPEVQLTPTEH